MAHATVSTSTMMLHATNSGFFSNHYSTNSKLSESLPQQRSAFVLSPSSTSVSSSYKGVTSRSIQAEFASIQLQLPSSKSVSAKDSTSTSYRARDSTVYFPRSQWSTAHSRDDVSSVQYFRSNTLSSPWSSTFTQLSPSLSGSLPQQMSTPALSPSSTSSPFFYKGVTSSGIQAGFSPTQSPLSSNESLSVRDPTSTSYWTRDLTSTQYSSSSAWLIEYSTKDASSPMNFRNNTLSSQYLSIPWSSTLISSTPSPSYGIFSRQYSGILSRRISSSAIYFNFGGASSLSHSPLSRSSYSLLKQHSVTSQRIYSLSSLSSILGLITGMLSFKSSRGSSSFSLMSGLMGDVNSFYLSIGQSTNTKISLSSWSAAIPVNTTSISPSSHLVISMLKPTLSCKFYCNCYGFVCCSGMIYLSIKEFHCYLSNHFAIFNNEKNVCIFVAFCFGNIFV